MKLLKLPEDGKSIQTGQTYTYRYKNYCLQTVVNHFPGSYADQQHINALNLNGNFSIFHTNPAEGAQGTSHSPNYWVGYGVLPYCQQYRNFSFSIYNLKKLNGLASKHLLQYTHLYFPTTQFDSAIIDKNYAFGKKDDVYCGIIACNTLRLSKQQKDDLIQLGQKQFWILQSGNKNQYKSFSNFCSKIRQSEFHFDSTNNVLTYNYDSLQFVIKYRTDFTVNGKNYIYSKSRFNSPYYSGDIKNGIKVNFNNKSVFLNFYKMQRIVN